ncbi:hypothetical protein K2X05_13035 [bacterium]|nr:hypothetical protein [bacterium]
MSLFIFTILLISQHSLAQEVALPHYLNFDGQLVDSSDNPIITATSVAFDIYDPSGNCLLYNETQTITPDTNGEFSTKIGPSTGNTSSPNDGNLTWNVIFKNDGQLRPPTPVHCPAGYTPAVNDGRKLRVTVSGTPLSPDYTLAPVPMATVAETLQGKKASDFILASPTTGTSTLNAHLQIENAQSLKLGNATNPSTNFVSVKAPNTFAASYTLILPTDAGTSGQILTTNGSGTLFWTNPSGGGAVTSVFGRTGAVVAALNDYSASQIANTAAGNIAATTVQAAINELDSEKLSLAGGTYCNTMEVRGFAVLLLEQPAVTYLLEALFQTVPLAKLL